MKNILLNTSSFDVAGMGYIELLKSKGLNPILNPFKRKLNKTELINLLEEYKPIGVIAGLEPYDEEIITKYAENLKIISRVGVGIDSVDMESANRHSIAVTITPTATTIAVTELTIGILLALLRKIPVYDQLTKAGKWERLDGNLLNGKTVGLIGCGRIGTALAKIFIAFGCEVIGYDPFLNEHQNILLTTLDNLLSKADIVSLHVPYTAENKHLINKENAKYLKKGAYLLNIARGGLIDESIICGLIKDGTLKGIAFDCFEEEPYTGDLLKLEEAILTPHIGSAAMEARVLMEKEAIENLLKELNL